MAIKLQDINKARYRKHLNIVIGVVIVLMLSLSLGCSTLLIQVFGSDGSHFKLNLAGVAIAGVIVLLLLKAVRYEPFMYEVMYVWELKKSINLINRHINKVIAAVEEGDKVAMQILNYCYQASKQLYTLDDNTVNMDELNQAIDNLQKEAQAVGLVLDLSDYQPEHLADYR